MEQKQLNREQQEVLALLKEIDAVCRKNQITYFLSPRLTLCATEGKPFPSNPLSGNILMKVSEMERFRKAAEAELPEGRALESMKNNPRFPGFFRRFFSLPLRNYCIPHRQNSLFRRILSISPRLFRPRRPSQARFSLKTPYYARKMLSGKQKMIIRKNRTAKKQIFCCRPNDLNSG